MFRLILFRGALIALPVVCWLIWADIARRRGKPMGSTPWAWLIAAGVGLAAASLLVTGILGSVSPAGEAAPLHSNAGPPHTDAPLK